ncbi:MAG TPA: alpha/beta hydrolase [Alphaproteobacteria bacterium]|nr:alpha/beta hydrolase [Alphaproteobacteria bacterium]
MATTVQSTFEDKFADVDGMSIRYIEDGSGPAVLLFHGASLGSSADVYRRTIGPLAAEGFRVIAFDFPGFGLSEYSEDGSIGIKKKTTLGLMDALGIDKAALVGHSQAGNVAVQLGLENPERVSHVVILGCGSLLPPLEGGAGKREEAVLQRMDKRMAQTEPTIEDTRKLLEANLFHHELITDEELELRHSRSVGRNFEAFVARNEARAKAQAAGKGGGGGTPLWQRLTELKMPLLMIYGREDRARAADRFALLKEKEPDLNMHLAEGCKHLVPWDAADLFQEVVPPFLKN